MKDVELIDYYRNLYQIEKKNKENIERECEELNLYTTLQNDLNCNLRKKIKDLNNSINILESLLRKKTISNKDKIKKEDINE